MSTDVNWFLFLSVGNLILKFVQAFLINPVYTKYLCFFAIYITPNIVRGYAVAQLVEVLSYKLQSRVRFQMESLEFFIDLILPVALWPWGRFSPPSCADCLEILEPQPPGTARACPGL